MKFLERINVPSSAEFSTNQTKEILNLFKGRDDLSLVLRTNSNLLVQMLALNKDLALEAIDNMEAYPIIEKDAKKIVNSIGIENMDFKKHPNLIVLLGHYIFNSENNISTRNTLVEKGIPFAMFDVENITDVKKFETNEEVLALYNKIYFDSKKYTYNREDEEKILKLLNSQFDSLEDEIASMEVRGLTRKDLTPLDMLAIALFVKKDHYNKGLNDLSVSLFEYVDSTNNEGNFYQGSKRVQLSNGHDDHIIDMIHTLIHENNHAKQYEDVVNCDVNSDQQIVVYAKDEMLNTFMSKIYGIDFYNDNYWKTAIEYDTEAKSIMQIMHMFRLDDQISHTELTAGALYSKALEVNKYALSSSRMHNETGKVEYDSLLELFDKYLPEMINKGVYSAKDIKDKFPIIAYEYNLYTNPVTKISNKELIEKYINEQGVDKDIYLALIRHRLDSTYNKNTIEFANMIGEYLLNHQIEDKNLEKAIKDEELITTRTVIEKNVIIVTGIQLDNYLRSGRKILEQRENQISTEEFYEKIGR